MSIGAALSNAYSGLVASSRMAELISSNVANALNENYSRRRVELSADMVGGQGAGVRVSGTVRTEVAAATAARRDAASEAGNRATLSSGLQRLQTGLGLPGDANSLPDLVSSFETSLTNAAETPESNANLANALAGALALAARIQTISASNQAIRVDAEADIARQVDFLNSAFLQINQLNQDIRRQAAIGGDTSALADQRKMLIDAVAEIIPVKTVMREGDQIAVFSAGGAQLVDGNASELGFSEAGVITSDMNLGAGTLSGLTLNGRSVDIGQGAGILDGGALAANFALRDLIVPEADRKLDAFAEDLIRRFESPAADATLASGSAGLFTDQGQPLDPADTEGLAGRIAVNALADPDQGGAIWRLRTGLYAAAPGDTGDGITLATLRDALQAASLLPSNSGLAGEWDLPGHASEMVSTLESDAFRAEEQATFLTARAAVFKEQELAAIGVNTDKELQDLLLVEQAYAANARVISVIDGLLKTLMEM
jgi:flagellar hook-associated protein 1